MKARPPQCSLIRSAPALGLGYLELPFGKPRQVREAIRRLHGTIQSIVDEKRRELAADPQALRQKPTLTLLERLCCAEEADEDPLTAEEVVHNVFGLVAAGFDTTSTALTHICFMLAEHQTLQQQVFATPKAR